MVMKRNDTELLTLLYFSDSLPDLWVSSVFLRFASAGALLLSDQVGAYFTAFTVFTVVSWTFLLFDYEIYREIKSNGDFKILLKTL